MSEDTQALIEALADTYVGESPGDYDAPPFLYPAAEAAAESLADCFADYREEIMAQTRVSDTAAYYVARMLRRLDQVEPLLELCRHRDDETRAQAVNSLPAQYERSRDPRLVSQLLRMLSDPSSSVTYNAVGHVKALLKKEPSLISLADGDLVGKLMARCACEPQAGTFSEALDFFDADARVFDFKVDQAAAGYDRPCRLLQYEGMGKLREEHVARLCAGTLTVPLIDLLAWLGERAVAAAPRLRELLHDGERGNRAVLALLAMPSQARSVLEAVLEIYLEDPPLRGLILRWHPDREALARAVLPRLAPLARQEYGDAFRGVALLGPLAASEVPWLVERARLGVPDAYRDSVVALLGEFGAQATPAFANFYKLLEYSSTRTAVLRTLIKLGPWAAEFATALEVLQLERRRYGPREERTLIDQALAAVTSAIFPG